VDELTEGTGAVDELVVDIFSVDELTEDTGAVDELIEDICFVDVLSVMVVSVRLEICGYKEEDFIFIVAKKSSSFKLNKTFY
jgi:hypothetical protein